MFKKIFSQDKNRDNSPNEENKNTIAERSPELVWEFDVGAEIESSPVVSNGIVYFGCNDGYLYALDISDGQVRWKFQKQKGNQKDPNNISGCHLFSKL